jgi:acyl-CoA synthetase (AMP-forming)/AMP-acid ligase II
LGQGIFCTSDLGEILGNQLYLRGRATDQINVAGRKVSPEAIERILSAHPAVRECVVFGIPSPEIERGDTIIACLSVHEQIDSDVLKEFLITRLPAWQMPREWQFVDSLEVNGRGKLSRAHWRHTYLLTTGENGSLNPGLKRRR